MYDDSRTPPKLTPTVLPRPHLQLISEEGQFSAASEMPNGDPVSVGTAPTCVTVGNGWKARPVEMAEDASSLPPGRKPANPPSDSLDEAATATVTLGRVGSARVGVPGSSLASPGSAVSALSGAAAGREAAGAGAATGAAALGAGDRDRSAIWDAVR